MRYILYARKSSEEKTKQVQSIEDQIQALRPIIEGGNLELVLTLSESRSAKAPGRPVFNEMLDRITRGEADGILCWHINRLTRNPVDSGTIRWMLQQGVIREIVTPHRTYRPEDNALISAVESAMGEQFLVELIQSSRRGMLSKIEKGWFPGRVPQGYRNELASRTIVRDEERWNLVRRAWTEFSTGRYSVPMLAAKMTDEWGYCSPAGGRGMAPNTLYRILSNRFYTGVFEFERQIFPGKHEPMVSHDEFAIVQRLMKRDIVKPTRTKMEFAFNGLMTCGYCGRAVCGDRKRKIIKESREERLHTYYACSRGSRCNPYRIKEQDVFEMVQTRLEEVSLPEEYLHYARETTRRHDEERARLEKAIDESRARMKVDLQTQIDELITLRSRRQISDVDFDRMQERLRNEQMILATQVDEETRKEESGWKSANRLAEFCVTSDETFQTGTVAQKGLVARQLGASYVLKRGKLKITENELLGLVRAHKKRTFSLFTPLEPLEISSGSGKMLPFIVLHSCWGGLFNESRTKCENEGLSFPAVVSERT